MFTIARRRLVDELRRRGRRREQLGAIVDEGRDDLALESIDGLERALAMVRRLRADQADAVLLRVVADLDVAQVADVMGCSEGSVRVLVHRGLRRLRELAEADVTELERSAMDWEARTVHDDDITPSAAIDGLLGALRQPARPDEVTGELAAVSAMADVVACSSEGTVPMHIRAHAHRVVAVAGALAPALGGVTGQPLRCFNHRPSPGSRSIRPTI